MESNIPTQLSHWARSNGSKFAIGLVAANSGLQVLDIGSSKERKVNQKGKDCCEIADNRMITVQNCLLNRDTKITVTSDQNIFHCIDRHGVGRCLLGVNSIATERSLGWRYSVREKTQNFSQLGIRLSSRAHPAGNAYSCRKAPPPVFY
jgi:hypothetical protein